ncbi:MAG: SRPBCC family protein, partial [Acidobacteriota bacterium]
MIRRVTRIDAPVAVVRQLFLDTDLWPQWMPGVAATRTLEEAEDRHLAEVVLQFFGQRVVQQLECRLDGDRVLHHQVAGKFKKWDAAWSFESRPQDGGTLLSLELDFDLGLAGLVVPRRMFRRWVAGLIQDTVDQARE